MSAGSSITTDRQRSGQHPQIDGASESSPKYAQTSARHSSETSRGYESRTSLDVPQPTGSHQRIVLTDPVAFRYLEEDPSTTVLERRRDLTGYQCYIVEQWATSRSHPTFVITTYTGDPSDKVIVGVLSVPTDETVWSPRLRVYFKALNQYHARSRETPLGIMMVTNLSGFPSSLTVITVSDGDLRNHRADFFVNENLKRLGCSGRVGLTLAEPNGATIAKFHQLYRTSDKNKIYSAVTELVKLCQAALHLFGTLEIEYADGLLCDVTEKAINDWWVGIGAETYNVEPRDGILGPTTVAALLGLLLGSRNRLHAVSAPVPKDPFDVEGMKRGIANFQKTQRLTRNRRLDHRTLQRLHKASEKAAYSEGWSMPRAVKSTVAELSGKGGEMLADVVGRRDKAGIAEIETSDIDHFVQFAFGERCKWLWYGKPYKGSSGTMEGQGTLELKSDEQGGFTWTTRKPTIGIQTNKSGDDANSIVGRRSMEDVDREQQDNLLKSSVMKRATGLISDGRSGFDRIKDAVHIRGHQSRMSKDESPRSPQTPPKDELREMQSPQQNRPGMRRASTTPNTSPTKPRSGEERFGPLLQRDPAQTSVANTQARVQPKYAEDMVHSPHSEKNLIPEIAVRNDDDESSDEAREVPLEKTKEQAQGSQDITRTATPVVGPSYHGIDLDNVLPAPEGPIEEISPLLLRTQSFSTFQTQNIQAAPSLSMLPRHLSFSIIEGITTSTSSSLDLTSQVSPSAPLTQQLISEKAHAITLKHLRAALTALASKEATWTHTQITQLASLLSRADTTQAQLESSLHDPSIAAAESHAASSRLLEEETEILDDGRKELETLAAKLEYEVESLRGKVGDVELGVRDFERAVKGVEARVEELEAEGRKAERGWSCVVS